MSPTDSRFSEAGDTLIEVLLTLVVLGLASVALIIAFSTSISASAEHRRLATADIVLGSVSQQAIAGVGSQLNLFTVCQSLNYYQTNVPLTVPASYLTTFSAQITQVQYWNAATAAFQGTCVIDAPQLITVTVTGAGGPYFNSFVVDYPLASANSASNAGAPAKLVFIAQPSGVNSVGLPFNTQPVVAVEDVNNNLVTTDLSPVTLSIQTGTNGAILSGCSGNEISGVVTFTGCSINLSGNNYTLLATDGNLTSSPTSPAFTIGGSSAPYIVFTSQPVGGPSGSTLATQPAVSVYLNGSLDSAWSGTVNLAASGGVLSGGCATVTVTNGVGNTLNCTFQGGTFFDPVSNQTLAIPYTLFASSPGIIPATSSTFHVSSAGAASQLVFTTQPSGVANASPATPFTNQPAVAVEDAFGNVVTSSNATVSLTMTGGGALSGCSPSSSNGVVTFTGCQGSVYGTGFVITASSGGLASAISTSFNITGVPASLVFTTQPAAGNSGSTLATQPMVTIYDSGGRVVTSSTAAISLTVSGNATLLHCTGLAPVNGVISVTTCALAGTVGTAYTLTATQGALSVISSAMTLTGPGPATQLAFTTQPVAGVSESPFATQPVVSLEDSAGNVATTSSATLTIAYSGGLGSSSCTNLQSITGVVNLANCTFAGVVGTNYTMTASVNSLTSATSSSFSPTGPGAPSQLILSGCPSNIIWNTTCGASAVLKDQFANVETAFNSGITFAQNGGSGSVNGLATITATNGVANVTLTGNTVGLVQLVATEGLITSNNLSFSVNGAPQSVAFYSNGSYTTTTVSGSTTYSAAGTYQLFAQGSGGGTISFVSTTSSVCTVNSVSGLVTLVTAGTCSLTADAASTNHYADSGTTAFTLSVNKGNQTVSFTSTNPSPVLVGGATYTPAGSATSGLGVTFSIDGASTAGTCSISGGVVTFTGVGTCLVDANQAGNISWNAAPQVQQSITVNKGNQTISFTSANPSPKAVGSSTYTPTGTATSGLAVAFAIDASSTVGACSISGGVVTFTGVGTCLVDANQAGNSNWNAAPQVQQSITVSKGNQTISFTSANPSPVLIGGATYTPSASGGASGNPVTFTIDASSTAGACSISGGAVSFTGAGTCLVDANQAGNSNWNAAPQVQQSITVNKLNQTITFTSANPSPVSIGAIYTPTATGGASGNPVTFTIDAASTVGACTLTTGSVHFNGAGTCVVDANQAGNGTYNAATPVQQSITVNKTSQTVSFTSANPSPKLVGSSTYTPTGTATSGLAVAFTIDAASTAGACSISGGAVSFTGAGTCIVDANQAGNATYAAAPQVQQSITVNRGNQTISFTSTNPSPVGVAAGTYTPTGTATSGLAVAFTIDASSTVGACSISGGVVNFTGVGTCKVDANQAGSANWNAATQVQQSITVTKGNQTATFSTSNPSPVGVGATYTPIATATSGLAVVITIDPSSTVGACTLTAGTVHFNGAGTCKVDANQAGNANYNAAPQVQQVITVTSMGASVLGTGSENSNSSSVTSSSFTAINGSTVLIFVSLDDNGNQTCTSASGAALTTYSLVQYNLWDTNNENNAMCVFSSKGTGVASTVSVKFSGNTQYAVIQVVQITGDNNATVGRSAVNAVSGTTSPQFNLGGTPSGGSYELLFGNATNFTTTTPVWSSTVPAGYSFLGTQSMTTPNNSYSTSVYFGLAAASITGSLNSSSDWGTIGVEIKP